MNKYVFVLIVCAVVFLVCFLIDSLLKLLFPKSRLEKSKQVVRPPRRSAVIGVILTFAGAAMLVKLLPEKGDLLFILGSIVAVIFGVILLCTYFSFVIYYDDEGFLYKAWGHGKQEFRYSQIRGQRSLLTRGGVNTILFVGKEEINLYSAMQNLNAFLSKAFFNLLKFLCQSFKFRFLVNKFVHRNIDFCVSSYDVYRTFQVKTFAYFNCTCRGKFADKLRP